MCLLVFNVLPVVVGDSDCCVRDEAAVAIPADRSGGAGGIQTRSAVV